LVKFIRVSYRNFLSSGNIPIEIKLNKTHLTLISGKNGSGKSTIVEAIVFGLFGKPYRNINKNQLINSINQKQCLVELDFEIGKKKYRIVRGIKPNVFEIYENGKVLNQNPNIRDHQKVLESQILKMSYKTFTQVVMMGSGNYIPFMELQPYQRREFIEDLLDIKIFSVMNTLVKDRVKSLKDEIRETDLEIKSLKEKALMQKSFIEKQVKEKDENKQSLHDSIEKNFSDNKQLVERVTKLREKVDSITSSFDDSLYEKLSELRIKKSENELDVSSRTSKRLIGDVCPTCKQDVSDSVRMKIDIEIDKEVDQLSRYGKSIDLDIININKEISKIEEQSKEVKKIQESISVLNEQISINNAIIMKDQGLLESISDTTSIDEEKEKLRTYAKAIVKVDNHKKKIVESLHLNTIVTNLLQDSGIKAKIIKQYVPVINKLVNKYLAKLDFFVSFNLDENFNESVKSRHRDEFTWGSFSEGQKMRINLALIFTWREIARMKNSINTNIVFFDELLDSSMDGGGMDLALGLLDDMKDSNVFVISHREGSFDKFPSVIQMGTKNNFTIIQD
jgi:DNA repair exonuclease SbcCD ATPase subunit